MNSWRNMDDIEKDLFEYSDMYYNEGFTPAPPKSISEYKARTSKQKNPGIFDDIPEEPSEIFIAGRGIFSGNVKIVRPGKVANSHDDESVIIKRIREVSGLGYRNEVIEQSLRKNFADAEDDKDFGSISKKSNDSPIKLSSSKNDSFSPKKDIADEINLQKLSLYEEEEEEVKIVSPKISPKRDSNSATKRKKKKKFVAFEGLTSDESSSSASNDIWRAKNGNTITR